MSAQSDEAMRLLREIHAMLRTMQAPAQTTAPDRDLDGPHGNFIIKAKDPKDWTGDTMRGKTLSECPPEYLDLLAERYDYFAGRETDETKARYNRTDAARCRGWAARLRAGWKAPASAGDWAEEEKPRW